MIVLLVASAANAQAQDDPEVRARAIFEEGMSALNAGDAPRAEEQFREAFALVPRASIALNLALVLQERGKVTEAVTLFERLLAGEFGELPIAREQIEEFRARSRDSQGVLQVDVAGARVAQVFVDQVDRGSVEGSLLVTVDPGPHEVRVESEGFHQVEREVSVDAGARRVLDITLAPRVAEVAQTLSSEADPILVTPPIVDETDADAEAEDAATNGRRVRRRRVILAIAAVVLVGVGVGLALALRPSGNSGFQEGPFSSPEALTRP